MPTIRSLTKPMVISAVVGFIVVLVLAGGSYAWAQQYQNRIAPNVWIGGVNVGGMDPETAGQRVREKTDELLTRGIAVEADGDTVTVPLSNASGTDTVEYAVFDTDGALERAKLENHDDRPILDTLLLIQGLFHRTVVEVPVQLQDGAMTDAVKSAFPEKEMPMQNGGFDAKKTASGWQVTVTPSKPGEEFDMTSFLETLEGRLKALSSEPIAIALVPVTPDVTDAMAQAAVTDAVEALTNAPYTLSYTAEGKEAQTWDINGTTLADMIVPSAEASAHVTVDQKAFDEYLDGIAPDVEVPAENARFQITNGRVTEFAQSKTGVGIDRDATRAALTTAMNTAAKTVEIAVTVTDPTVTTDQVNDLGITEALGVGTSNFKGSPANRIKNITNGVRLLNGLLIAPDETFSLLTALKPFTPDNGYYPELVIKGDKIEPEIGGGLCQIGTTTFRATMNSGLPVLERQNHSLVVSYYNDPANGNPGTDATIYDPAPDFKFKNDTGHYILFEAEMNTTTQQLTFTFWGTSDGRNGSYTPPVVERWIPTGPEQRTETTSLAPGVEQCQNAHVGADASFTYTVEHADGTKDEKVFESHYRALPKICLVGAAAPTETPPPELSTQEPLPPAADNVISD